MNEIVINFYWLIELFDARGWTQGYADKLIEKVTRDACAAHWFANEEEALRFLDKAPAAPAEHVWRVTEHGFEEKACST